MTARDRRLLELAREIASRPGGEGVLAMLAGYGKDDLVVIKHLGTLSPGVQQLLDELHSRSTGAEGA